MPALLSRFVPAALSPLVAAILLLPQASAAAAAAHPGSEPSEITAVGSVVFFAATSAAHGRELWVSDGTAAGTREVADLNREPGVGSLPWQLTVLGDSLLFLADDGTGEALWKTDGTAGGTKRLGRGGLGMLAVDGRLFYMGINSLWTSDGTAAGTHKVVEVVGIDDNYNAFAALHGNYYFFVRPDYEHPPQLWKSDGSAAGTVEVSEIIASGPDDQIFDVATHLVGSGDHVFFRMSESAACVTAGQPGARRSWGCIGEGRLWQSDGTAEGTHQVPIDGDVYPDFVDYRGALHFGAYDYALESATLWRTDGTASGTWLVKRDVLPEESAVVGPRLMFFTWRETGEELWRTKGTKATTRAVARIALPDCRLFSDDAYCHLDETPVAVANRLFFPASAKGNGTELWLSDGTAAGTRMVKNILYGGASSNPASFAAAGPRVFFSARDASHGRELWVTDGTARGTRLVSDINPG